LYVPSRMWMLYMLSVSVLSSAVCIVLKGLLFVPLLSSEPVESET
jgi:hypothetical protein